MPHTLLKHQKKVRRSSKGLNRLALFLEMRLGKTVLAIRWALDHEPAKALILAPLSVLPCWEEEIAHEIGEPVAYLTGSREERREVALESNARWNLLNYEGLRAAPELADLPWDVVVADESSLMRSPKAQITKIACKRLAHVPNRAILSGLPNPEGPEDFFEQMRFLHGEWLGCRNFWQFRQKHFIRVGYDWALRRESRQLLRDAVSQDAIVLSRKEAGVGSRKIRERRYVEIGNASRRLYAGALRDWTAGEQITQWRPVLDQWLLRICGGFDPDGNRINRAKEDEAIGLLKGELKREQVVVWFRFNDELHAMRERLKKEKIRCEWITGARTRETRANACRRFREGKARVFLSQIKCARFGLDLASADTEIYFSNSLEFQDRNQSEDRIVHPTKKTPLLVIDLVAKDTKEPDVIGLLTDKRMTARSYTYRLKELMRRTV